LSVVLLLSAVMVTAKRDKDRIAGGRIIQADDAAAEPKEGDKAIVQAANATKSMQADAAALPKPLYDVKNHYEDKNKGDPCHGSNGACKIWFTNELCLPKKLSEEGDDRIYSCGIAFGCSEKGYCWSSCHMGRGRGRWSVGWRWMWLGQMAWQMNWLRCSPEKGAGVCVDNAEAVGELDYSEKIPKKRNCQPFGTTSSEPDEKPYRIPGYTKHIGPGDWDEKPGTSWQE